MTKRFFVSTNKFREIKEKKLQNDFTLIFFSSKTVFFSEGGVNSFEPDQPDGPFGFGTSLRLSEDKVSQFRS